MRMTLTEAREWREWSIDDLVHYSGVSRATVYRIEAGTSANPSNDTVTKLENALRLKRGTLVFGPLKALAS